jgi:hypothetical protein
VKTLSCYKVLAEDERQKGHVGQGGGVWWTDVAGVALQRRIADELGAELTLHERPHGHDSFDTRDFDVAYVQLFDLPRKRPADFVWAIISDYIGEYGKYLEAWLASVKPDLLVALQYPLHPPKRIPGLRRLGRLPDLVAQCAAHGCKVVHLPWFNEMNVETFVEEKSIAGMCTGWVSRAYPWRQATYRYLERLGRPDVVLSASTSVPVFKLSEEEYHDALARTRYYFSGGIYDLQIPPKYFEVCNYGACLVTNPMPMLEADGFVDGETCIVIRKLKHMRSLLDSDAWRAIARAGQEMVHRRHSMAQRAKEIADVCRDLMGVRT